MGVEKQVIRPGTGPKPTPGQTVTVHCTGYGCYFSFSTFLSGWKKNLFRFFIFESSILYLIKRVFPKSPNLMKNCLLFGAVYTIFFFLCLMIIFFIGAGKNGDLSEKFWRWVMVFYQNSELFFFLSNTCLLILNYWIISLFVSNF